MRQLLTNIVVIFYLLFLSSKAFGQQIPQYTQYLHNTQLYNPAYVGSKEYLSMVVSSRLQWLNIDGGPITHNIAAHKKLKDWPIGIGASFSLDRLGPIEQKNINIDASYTIRPNENTKLAFGLKLGGEILTVNFSNGIAAEPNDPLLNNPPDSKFTPTVGAGAYWYSKNWYLGVSTMNLLHTTHFDGEITDRPHYFLLAGYVMPINRQLKFKPAILTKVVSGAPVSVNASANFLFNETFSFGLSYNNGQSLSAIIGSDLGSVLSISYSFDYSLKSLNQFSGSTHEIALLYRFTKSNKKHTCHTRFF